MTNWKDVPLPANMAHLEKDHRGFPVPFIVGRDNAGEPLFTINDDRLTSQCLAEGLCGICGTELTFGDLWWVGGPLSAFHPQGVYIDGPMHHECLTYALKVCPHLAAPRYTKRLDELPGKKNGVPFTVAVDHTVMPDRPAVFVQAKSISYSVTWPLTYDRKLMPCSGVHDDGKPRKWLDYEVWRHGEVVEETEGVRLIRDALEGVAKQTTRAPRVFIPEQPGLTL